MCSLKQPTNSSSTTPDPAHCETRKQFHIHKLGLRFCGDKKKKKKKKTVCIWWPFASMEFDWLPAITHFERDGMTRVFVTAAADKFARNLNCAYFLCFLSV